MNLTSASQLKIMEKCPKKTYQHANKRRLSGSILPKHHDDLGVGEFALHHAKFEVTLCFNHSGIPITLIRLNLLGALLRSFRNLKRNNVTILKFSNIQKSLNSLP